MVRSRSISWLVPVMAVVVIALGVLGWLQYRWINEVTDADRQRLRGALDLGARRFAADLNDEFARVIAAFQPAAVPGGDDLASRYNAWERSARDSRLIAAVYVVEKRDSGLNLLKLDPLSDELAPSEWPPQLAGVRERLIGRGDQIVRRNGPLLADVPAVLMPFRRPGLGPPPFAGGAGQPFRPMFPGPRMGGAPPFDEPAQMSGRPDRPPFDGPGQPPVRPADLPQARFVIALFDRDFIRTVMLPDLAQRYFTTPLGEYDVEVIANGEVLYRTNADSPPSAGAPDMEFPLLDVRPGRALGRGPRAPGSPREDAADAPWKLEIRHRGEPLESVIASARRRNLGISFAILALLSAAAVTLGLLVRRAERLRAQQLDFVAAITHELNTPLAALTSAGQNLADGIVSDSAQVARYGGAIVKESRRLTDMVAQVLDFAGVQGRVLRSEPVRISDVIVEAVEHCRWMAEERGVEMKVSVPDDLPAVGGDAEALTRAVSNLVTNAIKHGGEGKWVGVTASAGPRRRSVRITVADRGRGIPPHDVPRLFEPFFRGSDSGKTRGTGLGLAIVRQVARAHHGSVTVRRPRQGGAEFTIELPALASTSVRAEVAHA